MANRLALQIFANLFLAEVREINGYGAKNLDSSFSGFRGLPAGAALRIGGRQKFNIP